MNKNQELDIDFIEKLVLILNKNHLQEIEINKNNFKIRILKNFINPAAITYTNTPITTTSVEKNNSSILNNNTDNSLEHSGVVKSPMVGTVYLASSPNAKNFIKIGDVVEKNQTLLIIEAMKTMNNISATQNGKIIAILVNNEDPVEFGQSLVIIE